VKDKSSEREVPSATMLATFSGISLIHALLAAGAAIPTPIPISSISKESVSGTTRGKLLILQIGRPCPKRIMDKEAIMKPINIGFRYPIA
jgi:hypothetical protein